MHEGGAAVDPNSPIVIVSIDDKSLAEQGRWPWPRNKLAELIKNMQALGAAVIAMDMTFPETERNIAEQVFDRLKNPALKKTFETIIPEFDYDKQFGEALKPIEAVLGVTFHDASTPQKGVLWTSFARLNPIEFKQLAIPIFESYTSNVPILQKAAKGEGFINAFPDEDGVMRHALLVARYQGKLYPSLALEAIRRYTFTDTIQLVTALQGKRLTLQGLRFGDQTILTDASGRVLIPFRGTAYSFPYYSATDILMHRVPAAVLKDKLVFVGGTAFGLGDLHATAVQSPYPGVEVHANIASGILNQQFPTRPAWASGAELVTLLFVGVVTAVLFPFLGVTLLTISACVFPVILTMMDHWFWHTKGIVLSIFLPMALVVVLAVFNMAYGYLFENRRREQLKSMFGQYVPTAHVDAMLADPNQYSFQGQSKEMSVLFADIRNFTSISENMTAVQLKEMLNQYLTPMTEILFKHQGTVDKYVGDMVMAFWNAPLQDDRHAYHAILAALGMQVIVAKMQTDFSQYTTAPVKIGIGVNTGLMSVGDMGSTFRRAYTVLGDSVNLASRLEGQTKYYGVEIIVGEETYTQTRSDFLFRQLDRIKVKGKETAVTIYQPLCLLTEASDDLKQKMKQHAEALTAYFAQQWDIAEAAFKKLAADGTDNVLYGLYFDRIKGLRENPPGDDWDGAYVSHEK
jgi:adenylate cyclase